MPQNKLLHLTTSGIGFLVVGMIIVSFKLYDFSVQNKRLKDKISLEKSIHQNQISEIIKRYDSLEEYREAKTVSVKPEMKAEIKLPLNKSVVKQRFLASQTVTAKVADKKKLKAVNMSARGVRLISKDAVETNVSSKIDQVRVRFTLEKNKDVAPGDKQIFIQICNPKNRFLVLKGKLETKLVNEIHYNGLNTDACLFVNLHQHQLIVGDYKINLLYEGDVIGSTNFRVN